MKFGGVLLPAMIGVCLAVPASALNVCADPDYLPFSNRAGEGFENKVAEAVAKVLGEPLNYTWASHRGNGGFPQFLSSTLDARKCDVIMSSTIVCEASGRGMGCAIERISNSSGRPAPTLRACLMASDEMS